MVLPVSEVFARHVSIQATSAFLLKEFAEDLGELVDDLNAALVTTGGTRDIFLNDLPSSTNLCLREYQHRISPSQLVRNAGRHEVGVPDIVVEADLSFDVEAMRFCLFINRDPEGHYDEDKTEIRTYPVSDEGLQNIAITMAAILDEYLDLPEKMAYFHVISQKNAQAVLSL